MKKLNYIFFIFILFLTGCTNSIKCTIKTDDYSSKIRVVFKNKKLYRYTLQDIKEFNIYSKELEAYYNMKYNNYYYLIKDNNAKIDKGKDYVSSFIEYDFKNKDKNDIIPIEKNDTLLNCINKIENFGYVCK